MDLLLEIEFLTGAYRGTEEPASERADWPPQPDRVFSALVSAWAARGEAPEEREALEWLERQPPPRIHASDASQRTTPEVFVPPNDDQASKAEKTYLHILPDRRRRQARRFPSARPHCPTLVFAWSACREEELQEQRVESLRAIARDVGYVGHSASLVRCLFRVGDADDLALRGAHSRRGVYPGRLEELESAHRADPVRPKIAPGATIHEPAPELTESPSEWLILEITSGWRPDLLAASLVCRDLRNTLMSGYRRIGAESRIPEVVSGHAPDGSPTKQAHVAIVPLAFVGREHATAGLHGLAVVPPPETDLTHIPELWKAFETVARYDPEKERRILELRGPQYGEPIRLSPAGTDAAASLSPSPYLRPSRVWATVTPIVLDRHLKKFTPAEMCAILENSCVNAGLPRPCRIQVGRHSAVAGAPSVVTGRGAPLWTKWRVPESFRSRTLVHAVIDFGEKVTGPVFLGAGRFTGLGLCRRFGG